VRKGLAEENDWVFSLRILYVLCASAVIFFFLFFASVWYSVGMDGVGVTLGAAENTN